MFFSFSIINPVSGQKEIEYRAKSNTVSTEQHQPIDIVFKVSKLPAGNPFDLVFGATITDGNKITRSIPAFYNGQGAYILRFSSEKTGVFQYETFSTLSTLSGLKGTIAVEKNNNPDIHGAVTVAPEAPQKFVFQDGEPYFALAFELDWLFALDADNKNGLPKTTEIIQSVKENGFNQIVMNVYAYDVSWKIADNVPPQYSYKKPPYMVFKGTNEQPDFSQLNMQFFQHFDRVIQHQAYPNIIWDVSKEALDYGRCDIPYINERIERIRRLDGYKRLVTVPCCLTLHGMALRDKPPIAMTDAQVRQELPKLYLYYEKTGELHHFCSQRSGFHFQHATEPLIAHRHSFETRWLAEKWG